MKINRNSPCPCGSGRKYKQCCLNKQAPDSSSDELVWRRIRREMDGLPGRMLRFTSQVYGATAIDEAWSEFMLWDEDEETFDPESPHLSVFMPWLLHCWSPNPDETEVENSELFEVAPTQAYLQRKGHQLAPAVREYLQSCLDRQFSFYEVERCDAGRSMTLRDVMTGELHTVYERTATLSLTPHELIFAQLASVQGVTLLEATSPVALPADDKVALITLRKRMRHQVESDTTPEPASTDADQLSMWDIELRELYLTLSERLLHPTLPELVTTDGETLEFHKLVYDIDSAQTAFDALKHLDATIDDPDGFEICIERDSDGAIRKARIDWVKMDHAGGTGSGTLLGTITIGPARLTAEVKSRERAERFKTIVEEKLAAHAVFRMDELQTIEQALAAAADQPPVQSSLEDDPEAQALIADYLRKHYTQWIDSPLPALDGRTPRQAAESADGREQVEALLQGMGKHETDLPPVVIKDIFDSVRRQLGLTT
jgi:hypothetical protein